VFAAAEVAVEIKPLDFKLNKLKKLNAPIPVKSDRGDNGTETNASDTVTEEIEETDSSEMAGEADETNAADDAEAAEHGETAADEPEDSAEHSELRKTR
jgi:hypothetical protein